MIMLHYKIIFRTFILNTQCTQKRVDNLMLKHRSRVVYGLNIFFLSNPKRSKNQVLLKGKKKFPIQQQLFF